MNFQKHFDGWTLLVIFVTLVLFVTALFTTGFTHDLLLEAGVFLVSVKMMLMGYSISVANKEVKRQLDAIELAIEEISRVLPRDGDRLTERSDGTDATVRHSAPFVG